MIRYNLALFWLLHYVYSCRAFKAILNPRSELISSLFKIKAGEKMELSSTLAIKTLSLPELVVFDLDMCLWSPEMYTLDEIPTIKDVIVGKLGENSNDGSLIEGVVGVRSGYEVVKLFPASLLVLQRFYLNYYGEEMRIAAASSADTPRAVEIGKKAMSLLEVFPGITVRDVFAKGWPQGFSGNLQIGRQPPLSSNKSLTHFPILKKETGIDYSKMIFFDDCIWGDHCTQVASNCPGVVTQRTPRGLQMREWESAINTYHTRYSNNGNT